MKIARCALFVGVLLLATQQNCSANRKAIPSALLQDDYKRAFADLDRLASVLQYLGQVVNSSSSYDPSIKQSIRLWIFDRLKDIKQIRPTHDQLHERTLLKMVQHTRVIALHLVHTVNQNFARLAQIERPVLEEFAEPQTKEEAEQLYKKTHTALEKNSELLLRIERKVSTLGLTWVNRCARTLDSVNERYQITRILEQAPRFIGLAALGVYLTPYDRLKNIPLIGTIKRKLGTTNYWDEQGSQQIKSYPKVPANKAKKDDANKTWAEFFMSDDSKALKQYAGMALLLLNHDYFTQYLSPIKTSLRGYWNKLKGFSSGTIGTYKHPDITLSDSRLIGLESQIAQMKNIVDYVTEPEKFDRSASGLEKGILLTGPSRNGKTYLAQALCGSLNEKMQEKGMTRKFGFKEIKWSELCKWSDDNGLQKVIEEAKLNAPCVLFIDELHNMPLQTKDMGGKILNEFLTMTDSLKSTNIHDAVIVLAATNRPQSLDDALLKPGRFGLQIRFEKPTFLNRTKFFNVMCQTNALDPEEYDLESLARQTQECSYGDLDLIFRNARFKAHNEGRRLLQRDFQECIDTQINRIRLNEVVPLPKSARNLVAAHQAGHAFMHLIHEQALAQRLETVTLYGRWDKIVERRLDDRTTNHIHEQRNVSYGHIFTSDVSELVPLSVDPYIKAQVYLAGSLAEQLLIGSTTYSYHPEDTQKALQFLEKVTMKGLSAASYTAEELIQPKKEAKKLLIRCQQDVLQLLKQHEKALRRLAQDLNEKMILRHDEVKKILENPDN